MQVVCGDAPGPKVMNQLCKHVPAHCRCIGAQGVLVWGVRGTGWSCPVSLCWCWLEFVAWMLTCLPGFMSGC
jgi:hypothetical protein